MNRIPYALVLLLCGCSTMSMPEVTETPSAVSEHIGAIPKLETLAAVAVGEAVYTQFRYWRDVSPSFVTLNEPLSMRFKLGKITIAETEALRPRLLDAESAFCTDSRAYSDPLTGPLREACLLDRDRDGAFDTVRAAPGGAVWLASDVEPPAQYTVQEPIETIIPRDDAFKYELVYQGYSRGTLKMLYREYLKDMARPAFFQDIVYDVEEFPATVSFRTVRLEILDADNNGINYRVLSGFN